MEWTGLDESMGEEYLPISDCHFASTEFPTMEEVYGAADAFSDGHNVFAESISGHSSDSGNYSPTDSSLQESASSNAFHLENPQNWQQFPNNPSLQNSSIDPTLYYKNYYQTEEFPLQQEPYQEPRMPHPTPPPHHPIQSTQFIGSSQASMSQQHPHPSSIPVNKKMVLLLKQPASSPAPLQKTLKTMLLPVQSTNKVLMHPVKVESRVAPCITPFYSPPFAFTSKTSPTQNTLEEQDFLKKMEERKMRNRAAAQISRQKKKEEGDKLRKELEESSRKCTELEKENRELRKRIHHLEEEKKELLAGQNNNGSNGGHPPKRKNAAAKTATAGVCMLMLLSWVVLPDLGGFDGRQQQLLLENKGIDNNQGSEMAIGNTHGRSLQPTNASTNYVKRNKQLEQMKAFNGTMGLANGTAGGCGGVNGRNYNESLNLKLSEDLSIWVSRHEKIELLQLRLGKLPPLMRTTGGGDEQIPPLPKLRINSTEFEAEANESQANEGSKRGSQRRRQRMRSLMSGASHPESSSEEKPTSIRRDLSRVLSLIDRNKSANNGRDRLLPGLDAQQQMAKLVKGIKGRGEENVLYVIPIHDYFLLPPPDNGTAKVPRLSIILPALSPSLNSSSASFGQLAMIRIECEVVGTEMFYLPEGLVNSISNRVPPLE